MKNILLAASECVPFIKTGGLADVVGSLPKYFDKKACDARVILPCYMCISWDYRKDMRYVGSFYMNYNGFDRYVGVKELVLSGVRFYFIDNEEYFGGDRPYTEMSYDIEKFGFFSKAVLAVLPMLGFRPDVIHCNDWHTGLIPVYLKTLFAADPYYQGIKSVMTIHNLRFQGRWGIDDVMRFTGLPGELFTPDKLEFYGDSNYLKGGILYADAVTTVSDTYVDETKTAFYGDGLDGVLNAVSGKYSGIVNGIDFADYDPAKDSTLSRNFSLRNFKSGKAACKAALQRELGLFEDPDVCLVGIVSRMTEQKGFDLIGQIAREMLGANVQFAVLGTGDRRFEDMFRELQEEYPGRLAACIHYSEAQSRRIYAGSDMFLMPSLFEPCGLSQLIALRYGSLPLVRRTGGLRDTVIPLGEAPDEGTGFAFYDYDAGQLLSCFWSALDMYYNDRAAWSRAVRRAMKQDFSWTASARRYEELYEGL